MTMKRRDLLKGIGATAAITTMPYIQAHAQAYPARPITLVVSFAPGGLTDIPARIFAAELQKRIGQSVVVENKAGASGVVGGTYVWRAEPDGYTLLVNAISEVQNLFYISVPYNAVTDFAQIGKMTDGPQLLMIVPANSPYKSLAALVADAKSNPSKLNFSTSGPATSPAIAVSQLNSIEGINIVPVGYRGTGPAAAAVLANEVQGAWIWYPAARPLIEDGRVRALAVASPKRFESLPDVPTMKELGYRDFEHSAFVGLAVPKNTPPDIIAYLNKHLNDTIQTEEFQKLIGPLGMSSPQGANTPETYSKFLAEQTAFQEQLSKLTGAAIKR
jgi:tripartite-type tricarboxylate transporter receptor subunit TctC